LFDRKYEENDEGEKAFAAALYLPTPAKELV
jgi:hypothetical protein